MQTEDRSLEEALREAEHSRRTPEQVNKLRRALTLRREGRTWSQIGDALGITRQGASQLVKRALRGRPSRARCEPRDRA